MVRRSSEPDPLPGELEIRTFGVRERMYKPAPLRPGDTIAVVAPAGAVDRDQLARGVAALEEAGFVVRLGRHTLARYGYLAGTDQERAEDFCDAWRDPTVRAVFSARGGFGCTRLLPLLHSQVLRSHRKILLGCSDCTALLNHIVQRAELVTFHGPVVTSLADRERLRCVITALSETSWRDEVVAPRLIRPGMAVGRLLGGCLSVLVSLLATPYEPPWDGALLFLEDVREAPYRVDRMLTQLHQARVFERVAGVIFGEMVECSAGPQEFWSVWDVIEERLRDFPGPVVGGVPSGHGTNRQILPLGTKVEVRDQWIRFLESPFESESLVG